jgi:glycosyltransferase involved in cell wall biosynthesis
VVIPNCWDEENPLWDVPKLPSDMVRIGWIGTTTHFEDFQIARDALQLVMAERPLTKAVIGLDPKIYDLFGDIPETRKLFIPGMSYNEYPAFYKYTDIILVPLLDTHFNRAKSEIKLIEAGAAGQPWLASPLPAYLEWGAGGVYANTLDEWVGKLRVLVDSPELRATIGAQGRARAERFTSELMAKQWQILLETL